MRACAKARGTGRRGNRQEGATHRKCRRAPVFLSTHLSLPLFFSSASPVPHRKAPPLSVYMPLLYAPLLPMSESLFFTGEAFEKKRAAASCDPPPPSPLSLTIPLFLLPPSRPVRIGLRGRVAPATRDRLFFGAVLVALGHAGYVMSGDSSMGAGT